MWNGNKKYFSIHSQISANIVADILLNLLKEQVLCSRESCTCEYFTLLQSLHRGTLNIQ